MINNSKSERLPTVTVKKTIHDNASDRNEMSFLDSAREQNELE